MSIFDLFLVNNGIYAQVVIKNEYYYYRNIYAMKYY